MANWNCWIHCYNTFDWQIKNFILKASVRTILAKTQIKRKSGKHFCFLFLNWKVSSPKTFRVFFLRQKPHTEETSWRSGAYCIKLLPEKNSSYFNQSLFTMVKSLVKIMLTWVFRFYRSFSPVKFYAMGPWSACKNTSQVSNNSLNYWCCSFCPSVHHLFSPLSLASNFPSILLISFLLKLVCSFLKNCPSISSL